MNLEPNTYPVPVSLRLDDIWRTVWPAAPMLAVSVLVTVYAVYHSGWDGEGVWSLYALLGSTLAIMGWGAYWSWTHGHVQYERDGITLIFTDLDYYVPPATYLKFLIEEVWRPFRQLDLQGEDPPNRGDVIALTKGVAIIFESQPYARVREADGRIQLKRVLGATQPWSRYSRVAAHRALDPGVAGYELKLHCCHALFPGRGEAEDLEWMKTQDIL